MGNVRKPPGPAAAWAAKVWLSLGLVVVVLGSATARADTGLPSIYAPRGGPVRLAAATTARKGHGVHVQADPVVHLIFWGPSWTQDTTGIVPAEEALFRELPGSSYNAILGQYGVHNDERFAGAFFDTSAPPQDRPLTLSDLVREAERVRRLTHSRDPLDAQWAILPQLGTDMSNFTNECGEHDLLSAKPRHKRHNHHARPHKRRTYNVLLIPPLEATQYASLCIYAYSADQGQRPANLVAATTSLTSHEYAEAATDPARPGGPAPGWSVPGFEGPEIADLCAWWSATPPGMTINVTYLWSNALEQPVDGCAI